MNDRPGTRNSVQCHSGYTYAQRPVSFTHNGKDYQVERVITEKRLPEGKTVFFSVLPRSQIMAFQVFWREHCFSMNSEKHGQCIHWQKRVTFNHRM